MQAERVSDTDQLHYLLGGTAATIGPISLSLCSDNHCMNIHSYEEFV